MNELEQRYNEYFPEIVDVQHKKTIGTAKNTFHLHSDLEIVYALSDNLLFCTEKNRYPIPSGSIVLINSMMLHHIDYVRDGSLCDRYVLFFKPDAASRLSTPEINLLGCFVYQPEDFVFLDTRDTDLGEFERLLDSMDYLCKNQRAGQSDTHNYTFHGEQLKLRLQLGELLLFVNTLYRKQAAQHISASFELHSQLVMEVCRYIDDHLEENLTMDDLAHRFLVSKTQMFNIFKEILNLSVGEYIAQARIVKAKNDLINTHYSVEIISQRVGYASIASFSRVFKSKVGISPLQYRKENVIVR